MAIIDWPTSRAFAGAQFSLGLDVSESGFTGFLTGNRTRRSNLADRLRGMLTVPPAFDAQGGALREALMFGVRSNGDLLRMGMPHRKVPGGTLRGSPTVSASALAGARSFSITGALAGVNLLTNGGFEIDTNSDGIADGWETYNNGTSTGDARSLVAGNTSPTAQRLFASTLGPASSDLVGIRRITPQPVTAGATYSLSADFTANVSTFEVELYVDWLNSGGGVISASRQSWAAPMGWTRRELPGIAAPAGAVTAHIYAWMHQAASGSNFQAYVDNVQFEPGAVATPYAGLPTLQGGDFLAVGGNLLHVAYAGATLNDAGAGTVPLTLPLQKPLASSAAVTWNAPTGLWELDDDGLQLDYSAGVLQGGFAIPLRQVIA